MEKEIEQAKLVHIGFIGRLEKEKGVDFLLQAIKQIGGDTHLRNKFVFYIIGEGSYLEDFLHLKRVGQVHIHVYGNLSHAETLHHLKNWDILCVPSRFLETFGLVALEAQTYGVRVCGPTQGGLREFVSPGYEIRIDHAISDLIRIFVQSIDDHSSGGKDISEYQYAKWRENLIHILNGRKTILIIHDYNWVVGGAEVYINFLIEELHKLGCTAELYGLSGSLGRGKRILHAIMSPFAFWRYRDITHALKRVNPELIWIHNIMRYIGPWGIYAVSKSDAPKVITHHDLGLISARPSRIEKELELPHNLKLRDFLRRSKNPLEWILRSMKYITLQWIWHSLRGVEAHIVPSRFMKRVFEDITHTHVILFPHTLIHKSPISSEIENEEERIPKT